MLGMQCPAARGMKVIQRGQEIASTNVTSIKSRRTAVKVQAVVAGTADVENGRSVRRSLNQTGRYVRQPRDDPISTELMEVHGVGYSSSGLVAQMREQNNLWTEGDITVKLAKAYGYCWGVERAVRMAYEARQSFPDKKVYITNEIIHNPEVNQRLRELDIEIIEEEKGTKGKDYSQIDGGDVVIFPAFGATVQEMKLFRDKGVQMIDTTCPWVTKVWNSVDVHTKKSFTSIIHGQYSHEETIATASFATDYLVIKNPMECQYVCDYILNGGNKEEFLAKFSNAISKGFDPDTKLVKLGLANQTTMLKGDTQMIGKMLEATMIKKYGPAELNTHFLLMDTICDATQERQDALYEMTENAADVDFMLVVGGFNSSNTSHLQEISEHKGIPSFWVDSAARIDVATNTILHKLAYGELKETKGWLGSGPLKIGITSGASTPDKAIEEVLDKVFRIKNPAFNGIVPKQCTPVVSPTH